MVMVASPKTPLLLIFIYKYRRFFRHIPDAIFDVILLMSSSAILGYNIFGKKRWIR